MAYGDNYTSDIFSNFLQKRGASGRFPTSRESSAMFAPVLDYNLRRAQMLGDQAERRRAVDREMDLREEAMSNQKSAAIMGGIGQVAQLPLAYGAAKSLGWMGGGGLLKGGAANGGGGGLLGGTIPGVNAPTQAPYAPMFGADAESVGMTGWGSSPAGASSGLLGVSGPAAGLYGMQLLSSKYTTPIANKLGMEYAGKGWKYGGVPGAMVGGSIDIGKKVIDAVKFW